MASSLFHLVIVILLIQRSLSLLHSPQSPAQVNNAQPVRVSRGGHAELQKTFSINPSVRNTTGCEIHYIHKTNLSCGQVIPSVFYCSYEGVVHYQHFGCFGDKELVTFQLSLVPDEFSETLKNSQQISAIQVFSIELQVQDTDTYSDIHLIRVNSSFSDIDSNHSETSAYRLIFPNHLIGKCHYELICDFEHLRLPNHGEMFIEPNTILPCGFMPSILQYIRSTNDIQTQDYVLLRIYSYGGAVTMPIYRIIAIKEPTKAAGIGTKLEHSQSNLSIRQAVNTPVTPDKFIVDTIEIFGLRPIRYHVEIHPDVGSFRTVQSTDVGVSFTEFTREELIDGCVSFYPHYDFRRHTVSFSYSVIFDASGSVSADGVVVVTLHEINWEWPAQRTNNPLQVIRNQVADIDCSTIDFYRLNECESQSTMQLSIPPQHGRLILQNESLVSTGSIFLVEAVRNGAVLAYEQTGDKSMYDQMVWQVKCLDSPSIRVSMTVLIAQTDNPLPHCVNSSEVFVHQDWSQPLSISNFGIVESGLSC